MARNVRLLLATFSSWLALALVTAGRVKASGGAGRIDVERLLPETADLPRAQFDAFLRSPVGIALTIALGIAIFAGAFVVFLRLFAQPASRRPARQPRGSRKSGRRVRQLERATEVVVARQELVRRASAAMLCAGAILLPLAFTIALVDVFSLPKTIVLRLLALGLGALLIAGLVLRARVLELDIANLALIGFLAVTVVATAVSIDPNLSLGGVRYQYQGLFAFLAYGVLFVAARFALNDVRRVRALSAGLLAAGAVVSVYAIAQWLHFDPIWKDLYKGRVFSSVGQANALGSFLAMVVILSIALLPERSLRGRLLVAVAVGANLFAFLLTFSRGGDLGFMLGAVGALVVLLPAFTTRSARELAPKAALVAGSVVVVLAVLLVAWRPAGRLADQVASRAATILDPGESSNVSHLDLWAVGVRIALDHPLIGTGPDTYIELFPQYRDDVLSPARAAVMARFTPESPHNVYLAVAGGAGVLALIGYLLVIVASIALAASAALRRLSTPTRFALAALLGAVIVHLVTDSFMTGEPGTTGLFWILLGALAGLAGRIRSQDQLTGSPAGAPSVAGSPA